VTVLLAVSGGADSVALLRAAVAVRAAGIGRVCAVHVNHHLRGADSDADATFVADLCQHLAIPCEVICVEVASPARDRGDGLEAAARAARYDGFVRVADRQGARYLATAHTADDQAETILHHVLRGTGLAGLAGMARARPLSPATTLIRPLLGFRRSAVLGYLQALGQPFRQDLSNSDTQFTRNRIRHELLPQLSQQYNVGVVDALVRLGTLAGEAQEVLGTLVAPLVERCLAPVADGDVHLRLAGLPGQPRYLVRELLIHIWNVQGWPLQDMGFVQWEELADLMVESTTRETRKRWFPGGVLAERRGEELQLSRP
jgi:tRNA(Ile)-lysidine synthase